MSSSEYLDWISYMEGKEIERKRQSEIAKGNVVAMDEDQMIGALTGGR